MIDPGGEEKHRNRDYIVDMTEEGVTLRNFEGNLIIRIRKSSIVYPIVVHESNGDKENLAAVFYCRPIKEFRLKSAKSIVLVVLYKIGMNRLKLGVKAV